MNLEEFYFNKLDFTGIEKAYVSLHEAIFLLTVLEEVHDREFPWQGISINLTRDL